MIKLLKCTVVKGNFGKNLEYTGYDGSHSWKNLHNEVKEIECDYCKDKAIKLMRGLHDTVNIHLGKKPKYPNDLNFLHKYTSWAIQN